MDDPSSPVFVHISEDIFESVKLVIRRVLGFGMSGCVVQAQSTIVPECMIALKVLSIIDRSLYAKKKQLFQREALAMQKLNHPHLMKGKFAVESPYALYITMDYYRRGSLEYMLDELNYAQAMRYFAQLASAVKCMHDTKIVHCDIKLPNILVKSDQEVILSDFGLCLFIKENASTVSLREVGGTKAYQAPETRNIDINFRVDPFKLDVYSLGVVLWGMVFKKNPDKEKYDYQLVTDADTDIPEFLRSCILKMIKTDPTDRISLSDLLYILTAQPQWRELLETLPNDTIGVDGKANSQFLQEVNCYSRQCCNKE